MVKRSAVLALVFACGIAHAQNYAAPKFRLMPQASAPADAAGAVFLWSNSSNANHPMLHINGIDYDIGPSPLSSGTYGGVATDALGRYSSYDQKKAGRVNCRDSKYGLVGDGVTDDAAALRACRDDAIAQGNTEMFVGAGSFGVGSTIDFTRLIGFHFIGAARAATTFNWVGGAGGVMFAVSGTARSYFGHFTVNGSSVFQDTTGMTINGITASPGPAAVTTLNVYEDIDFASNFAYCVRGGQVHYQADQQTFKASNFFHASVAGVSIEYANDVLWYFDDGCNFQYDALGITAAHAGTGGHFSISHSFFAGNTTYDIEPFPSSRTTVLSDVASESSFRFLHIAGGSTASQVVCSGCSVNGITDNTGGVCTTSAGTGTCGVGILMDATGGLVLDGGKFGGGTGNSFQIKIGANNNRRSNIDIRAAAFQDSPFQTTSLRFGQVHMSGIQGSFVMDTTAPGTTDGFLPRGTIAAPLALTAGVGPAGNSQFYAPTGYWKIASGTVLASGDNVYSGTSLNCVGGARVEREVISAGGLPLPYTVSASDAGSNTFNLTVSVPIDVTLTSDLVVRIFVNPQPYAVQ